MKERIVIKRDIEYLKELEREREEMFMSFPEYRTEQVPESFAELLTLCKDLEDVEYREKHPEEDWA